MRTPTHVFGFPAKPLRPIQEVGIGYAKLGQVDVRVLRWERKDFIVEGLKPSDGWFVSFRVSDASGSQDLLQFRSAFFTPERITGLRAFTEDIPQGDGVEAPRWHKGDRSWPIVESDKALFVGQFYYDDTVAYVFVLLRNGGRTYIAFKDEVFRQDAEEHYADEEKRA